MRIFLIRHAESDGNVDHTVRLDVPDHALDLSARGRRQALTAGRWLDQHLQTLDAPPPFIRVWTSPYRRTRETARLISEQLTHTPWDLREHINLCEQQFGLFEGFDESEWASAFPDEWRHYEKCLRHNGRFWARMPLGESRFDVAVRVHQAFGSFYRDAQKHGIDTIAVVCHGVTLRAFVMQWLHHTPEWFDAEPNPPNTAIRLLDDDIDHGYIYPDS